MFEQPGPEPYGQEIHLLRMVIVTISVRKKLAVKMATKPRHHASDKAMP